MAYRFLLSLLDGLRYYLHRDRGASNEDIAAYPLGSDYGKSRMF